MNEPNRIDGGHSEGYIDPYKSTDAIVQEQTVKRINDAWVEHERKKREAWRAAIMFVLCVGALVGGFVLCKIMGWGE